MNLVKTEKGYFPAYESDRIEDAKIKVGDEVRAKRERNPEFHRKVMSLFKLGFESQEKISSFTIYRYLITIKAGFVEYHEGQAFPESISFENMSQERFESLFKAVREVISTEIGVEGSQIEAELAAYY